jgi:hypothetical protein
VDLKPTSGAGTISIAALFDATVEVDHVPPMVNAVPGGRSAVLTQATAIMPSVESTQLTSETVLALKAVHVLVPLDVLSDTPKIHDRKN